MRKRSTGAKSAPTSPINSLTPVGSRIDLVAYAEKARLARSGSVGDAMHTLRNQQWVGQSSPAGPKFAAGGHFFPSRPQYNNADVQYASPDEESQDEADTVSFSGRKMARGSARSRSNPAGGALDITVDATPALSRRPSEATLRPHSIQTTPQPEQVMETVPLPATTSPDSDIDQKTISILYSLRYLAAIPVIQTAVSNLWLALFAKASVSQTRHGLICLWAIVTAFSLVNLTTDLLRRWLYNCRYPPFPHILIRLLALQLGILFPSIHLGLAMLNPNPTDRASNQAVVAWCFLATTITMIGEAIRPWTNAVTACEDPPEHKNTLSEKQHMDSTFTTDGPLRSNAPLRFHSTRLRNSVGGPLFPTIFAYFVTSWVLLLTESSNLGL
ncbi:hypothetical protein M407DRAFT_29986 [Tulasnella calospora MUT 4182]|uniref:Uncharacterized protein n=1 Tax=Tulasnella calospora MUT 4182 TaxID=1051891 RepID=A0A0C3Q933_9AGAM|nr:hypothetical protein M407DRAFT_29986 [Tulasnella calospora MUT 4182]